MVAPKLARVRKKVLPAAISTFYRVLSGTARRLPEARPSRHGVEVIADLAYTDAGGPEHRLDVYKPVGDLGLLPVVVYIHGGSFRSLSKDTHWVMALMWARAGYLVFNLNYRLAPAHPYPAACEDLAQAWDWVLDHIPSLGGDPERIVVTGESAGGNLATVLAVAATMERPEPWARQIYARGRVPRAVVPCGAVLQVSDPRRWTRRRKAAGKPAPALLQSVIDGTFRAYAGLDPGGPEATADHGLMDPLCVVEAATPADLGDRPLPAFFLPVGSRDPLIDDHRRMLAAVQRLGGQAELTVYPGMEHSFHAFVKRPVARQHWQDCFDFCARVLEPAGG